MTKNGFSLIEVMVTIGIIGIIAGIGFPAIDNFGEQENFQSDLASIRGEINYIRQLSLEDGHAYRLKIINDVTKNSSVIEAWRAEGLTRYDAEFHRSTSPPCSQFGGTNENGSKQLELTQELPNFIINKCTSLTGNCTAVSDANNYFCILPDGSGPENVRGQVKASENAGRKEDFIHFYKSGFFNNGQRM